jgi:hypothetical protein
MIDILEWTKDEAGSYFLETRVGTYRISQAEGGWLLHLQQRNDRHWWPIQREPFPNPLAAIHATRAEYRIRIRHMAEMRYENMRGMQFEDQALKAFIEDPESGFQFLEEGDKAEVRHRLWYLNRLEPGNPNRLR